MIVINRLLHGNDPSEVIGPRGHGGSNQHVRPDSEERGFDFVPTTTSLLFTVAPNLALASIDGLPALPYDTVDVAMKVASTVSMQVTQDMDGLLTLQRTSWCSSAGRRAWSPSHAACDIAS